MGAIKLRFMGRASDQLANEGRIRLGTTGWSGQVGVSGSKREGEHAILDVSVTQ